VPVIKVDPVWNKDPVNTIVSTLAENIFPTLPDILTDPVTPSDPVIWVDPENCEFALTLNPYAGSVEAVTDPDDIKDKLRPTTLDAGIFVSPPPLPEKDPLKDPLNIPLPVCAKDADTAWLEVPNKLPEDCLL